MGNNTQSVMEGGPTQDRLTTLATELGLVDWREWLRDFGAEEVTAALVAWDYDSLPFMGEG